jgi:hypothetical protein
MFNCWMADRNQETFLFVFALCLLSNVACVSVLSILNFPFGFQIYIVVCQKLLILLWQLCREQMSAHFTPFFEDISTHTLCDKESTFSSILMTIWRKDDPTQNEYFVILVIIGKKVLLQIEIWCHVILVSIMPSKTINISQTNITKFQSENRTNGGKMNTPSKYTWDRVLFWLD